MVLELSHHKWHAGLLFALTPCRPASIEPVRNCFALRLSSVLNARGGGLRWEFEIPEGNQAALALEGGLCFLSRAAMGGASSGVSGACAMWSAPLRSGASGSGAIDPPSIRRMVCQCAVGAPAAPPWPTTPNFERFEPLAPCSGAPSLLLKYEKLSFLSSSKIDLPSGVLNLQFHCPKPPNFGSPDSP